MSEATDLFEALGKRTESLRARLRGFIPRRLFNVNASQEQVSYEQISDRYKPNEASPPGIMSSSELEQHGNLVLIGNAGSGKSYVLINEYVRISEGFLSNPVGPFPVLIEVLKDMPRNGGLSEAIELAHGFSLVDISRIHSSGMILFIDGLEEAIDSDIQQFANHVLLFWRQNRELIKTLIISCRRHRWDSYYFESRGFEYSVFHVDQLDYQEYGRILSSPQECELFYAAAAENGVSELLEIAFFGFDLAFQFKSGAPMPRSRQECLEERVEKALKGTERDIASNKAIIPVKRLSYLAEQIALLATFCGLGYFTLAQVIEAEGSSQILRKNPTVAQEEWETLLARPLFVKGNRAFSFSHEIFREYMAARAVTQSSLRKQRQLLCAPLGRLSSRISPSSRGVAIHLSEIDPKFYEYLCKNEPLLAALATPPPGNALEIETILDSIFAEIKRRGWAWWWGLTDRGERPDHFISRLRPLNVGQFLSPYINSSDKFTLLFSTRCAELWGGDPEINPRLLKLVFDEAQHIQVRISAAESVVKSGIKRDTRKLYRLICNSLDELQGIALKAFRLLQNPRPAEYIQLLLKTTPHEKTYGSLQSECVEWGVALEDRDFPNACDELEKNYGDLSTLMPYLVRGILKKANTSDLSISPPLLILILSDKGISTHIYESDLSKLLGRATDLVNTIWENIWAVLGADERNIDHILYDNLSRIFSSRIFELLPENVNNLSKEQSLFCKMMIHEWWVNHNNPQDIEMFHRLRPGFKDNIHTPIALPSDEELRQRRDYLADHHAIVAVLNDSKLAPWQKTLDIFRCLHAIYLGIKTKRQSKDYSSFVINPDIVSETLQHAMPTYLRSRINKVFYEAVLEIHFYFTVNGARRSYTKFEFYTAFLILSRSGFSFTNEKLSEVLACEAFTGEANGQIDSELLDQLRHRDRDLWEKCVTSLIERDLNSTPRGVFDYLIERKDPFFLRQAQQKLITEPLDSYSIGFLLDYFLLFRQEYSDDILWAAYVFQRLMGSKRHLHGAFRPLFLLLERDDEFAWSEVERLIGLGMDLSEELKYAGAQVTLSTNPARLPTLSKWLTLAQKNSSDRIWWDSAAARLQHTIVTIGGEEAIAELTRLKEMRLSPDSEWLGKAISEIEDNMLRRSVKLYQPGELLDFVNTEAMGLVCSDRDLNEWVCQGLEQIKNGLELGGEGVPGFWNSADETREPKIEDECQNVLWSYLRPRLDRLGLIGIEEKFIGPDREDLMITKKSPDESYKTIIELKVARKGYGADKVVDPLETQLWNLYMRREECRFGIFIVLWCKCRDYDHPAGWETKEELLSDLRDKAVQVKQKFGATITCFVIDLTADFRTRRPSTQPLRKRVKWKS
jgi:aryl carrier-like protein